VGPSGARIAFVSMQDGNEEIYVVGIDGSGLMRLTSNTWELDRHLRGRQTGADRVLLEPYRRRGRIWVVNADGSGQVNISNNRYDEWGPVWIK